MPRTDRHYYYLSSCRSPKKCTKTFSTCADKHEVGHGGLSVCEAVPGEGDAQVVGYLVLAREGEHEAGVLGVDQVQVSQVRANIRLEVVQSAEEKSIERFVFCQNNRIEARIFSA